MKTFSYFPGMFENPAPAKYYFIKTKSKILWSIYISVSSIGNLKRNNTIKTKDYLYRQVRFILLPCEFNQERNT